MAKPIKDRIRKKRKIDLNINTLARLIRLELKHLQPEYFNLRWIRNNVYQRVHDVMRRSGCCYHDNTCAWEELVLLLPGWEDKFRYSKKKSRTIGEATSELIATLEAEKPKTFGPKWMYRYNRPAFRRIEMYVDGDWTKLKKRLPEPWKSKFTYLGIRL